MKTKFDDLGMQCFDCSCNLVSGTDSESVKIVRNLHSSACVFVPNFNGKRPHITTME